MPEISDEDPETAYMRYLTERALAAERSHGPEPTSGYQQYAQAQARARENGEMRFFDYPANYVKSGPKPDLMAPDVAYLVEAARANSLTVVHYPGLVMIVCPAHQIDQWFVSFQLPDRQHPEQWFYEASGQGYVVRSDQSGFPLKWLADHMLPSTMVRKNAPYDPNDDEY